MSKKYDFKTPEGAFAIPFYFYDQHLKSSGAQALLDTLFAHPSWSDKQIKEALTKIRKQIKEGTLNPKLLSEVKQRMTSDPLFNSMRFRSSTNVEGTRSHRTGGGDGIRSRMGARSGDS